MIFLPIVLARDLVRALFTPIPHDRVLQIQNGFTTLYIYWAKTLRKTNQSIPTMYGGVSCRYVPVFGSNEVPDPVRAILSPVSTYNSC